MVQSRFGSLAFVLSFPNVIYQNFRAFKSHQRPQSLSQFGFQNSSGLLVSQIGLISRLVNLKVLKFKLTNCLRGIRNAWHFQHAVSFVIKVVCGSFCSALLTP
ncbi:hypothetical protein BOO33_18625 [Vibrio navarrensis]|nr:hypothetical protein [Vibrio navarrensis]